MPAPKYDDTDSDDEDSGQKAMKTAKALFTQTKDAGEKYGAAIIAVLVLFGLLYFWLVVLPKPVTVTIAVTEADSNAHVTGAQVEADYLASPYLFTSVKTSRGVPSGDGRYILSNVPSNTDAIPLRVSKSAEYENYEGVISTGDASKTAAVKLFKKTQLRFDSVLVLGTIGPTCTKTFNVAVYNNDTENDLEVALNATGLPYFTSERKTITAGETANVSFTIITNYPDLNKNTQNITGNIWILGTKKTVPATFLLTPKTDLKLDVTSISQNIGVVKLVKISNGGEGRITGIKLIMDDAARKLITLSGLAENEVFDLDPKRSKSVYLTGNAAGLGIIRVSADCTAPLELPVEIKLID